MRNTRQELINAMQAYMAKHGISGSTLTARATGNRALWYKLTKLGRIPNLDTYDKIMDYMERNDD